MDFTKNDVNILAKTIYGEARGELYKCGLASLIAVANVVMNRKYKNFAKTVADVCTAPHQFSCWNKDDSNYAQLMSITEDCKIFAKCLEVAENVIAGKWPDLTDGCDHYHERSIKPYWAVYLTPKRIFGSHYFYALKTN
jgi:spore germination cell wall hydrolase CwlJ-like protein